MPIRPPEFDSTALWLEPILAGPPQKLIAITGPIGAGKSTLARFLAWYFNISLVETDCYLIPHKGFQCEHTEVGRIIKQRHNIRQPVIVEGAAIFPLLAKIKQVPDGIIQVRNNSASRRPSAEEVQMLNPSEWGFDKCPTYEVAVVHDSNPAPKRDCAKLHNFSI